MNGLNIVFPEIKKIVIDGVFAIFIRSELFYGNFANIS